jgi:hypothetical protein
MDALVAIDALDDLLHNAPGGFLSDSVRVDPDEVASLLAFVRAGLPAGGEAIATLDQLEAEVRGGRPAAFGRGVRVNREALYELLDRLRASVGRSVT